MIFKLLQNSKEIKFISPLAFVDKNLKRDKNRVLQWPYLECPDFLFQNFSTRHFNDITTLCQSRCISLLDLGAVSQEIKLMSGVQCLGTNLRA